MYLLNRVYNFQSPIYLSSIIAFFFFFSIRRRHTSFSRDWSSDVCSSDLSQETTPSVLLRYTSRSAERNLLITLIFRHKDLLPSRSAVLSLLTKLNFVRDISYL